MGTYVITTMSREMRIECKEHDLIEIANIMTATLGWISVNTLDYNIFTENNLKIDDWSKTDIYQCWLVDNADNLGLFD